MMGVLATRVVGLQVAGRAAEHACGICVLCSALASMLLQSGAPFYVHRDVWETSTVPLDRTQAYFISCSEEPIKAGTSTMSSDDITRWAGGWLLGVLQLV